MNADGSGRQLIDGKGWGSQWSPKSNEIAYISRDNGATNLRIYDVEKKQGRMLLDKKYRQIYWGLTWSPDGQWVCFKGVLSDGTPEIAAVSVKGEKKGFKVLLPSSALSEIGSTNCTMAWGGTGSQILVSLRKKTGSKQQLYVLDFTDAKPPELYPGFPADWASHDPAWSPDGKKIVLSACPPATSTSSESASPITLPAASYSPPATSTPSK